MKSGLAGRIGTQAARRIFALVVLACVASAMSGCRGDEPDATPTETAPTATPTAIAPAEIGPIIWAQSVTEGSNAPVEVVEQFATDAETIYAVVRTTNLAPGAIVSASWSFDDTLLDTAASSISPPAAYADGYIEFHLTRSPDELWPDGTYAIEIALDGEVVQRSKVAVVET
jgi:hypothetical protein